MAARTILVIDNDSDVLEIVAAMLSRSFGEVLTAGSGAAGLEILRERRVDLVLAEALLPDMPASEFIYKVSHSFPFVVVMLMTAFCDEPLDAGMPVIEKPFTASMLRARIETVLADGLESGGVAPGVMPPRKEA